MAPEAPTYQEIEDRRLALRDAEERRRIAEQQRIREAIHDRHIRQRDAFGRRFRELSNRSQAIMFLNDKLNSMETRLLDDTPEYPAQQLVLFFLSNFTQDLKRYVKELLSWEGEMNDPENFRCACTTLYDRLDRFGLGIEQELNEGRPGRSVRGPVP